MRGDNITPVTIDDLHKSKLYVKTKQKFFKDINSFTSKVDKRKIVEVSGEWKLYKENKEVSTLTLKEAMLLFLAFGSWRVERSERSSQVANKHWLLSSPAEVLGHFISLKFDLIKEILEVASRQDYRQCNFFCFADSITLFKKLIRKKGFLLNLHPDRTNLSIDEPTSLYFFLFQNSFNAHARCTRKCFFAQRKIIFESQIDP